MGCRRRAKVRRAKVYLDILWLVLEARLVTVGRVTYSTGFCGGGWLTRVPQECRQNVRKDVRKAAAAAAAAAAAPKNTPKPWSEYQAQRRRADLQQNKQNRQPAAAAAAAAAACAKTKVSTRIASLLLYAILQSPPECSNSTLYRSYWSGVTFALSSLPFD